MKPRATKQFDLFAPSPGPAALPASLEHEVVALLAQMLEAILCSAGSPTEDSNEQDQR